MKYSDTIITAPSCSNNSRLVANSSTFATATCPLDTDKEFLQKVIKCSEASLSTKWHCKLDSISAIKLAVPAWSTIFGKEKISDQKLYSSRLDDSTWIVKTILRESGGNFVLYAKIPIKGDALVVFEK